MYGLICKMMKKLKFKYIVGEGYVFGEKKFYKIIFNQKKISQIWGAIISSTQEKYFPAPLKWSYKEIKFKPIDGNLYIGMPGRSAISYYIGKLKNKKRDGNGLEIILQIQSYLPEIVSFYKGNWKNGKKNGKGFWSNHHPLIGQCTTAGADNPKYIVNTNVNEECTFTGTFKNDDFDKGILINDKGSFKGSFKKGKLK